MCLSIYLRGAKRQHRCMSARAEARGAAEQRGMSSVQHQQRHERSAAAALSRWRTMLTPLCRAWAEPTALVAAGSGHQQGQQAGTGAQPAGGATGQWLGEGVRLWGVHGAFRSWRSRAHACMCVCGWGGGASVRGARARARSCVRARLRINGAQQRPDNIQAV
jgi:hypothetical protein